jgi:DNA-binding transcriptional regulator YhcF (GntR family)
MNDANIKESERSSQLTIEHWKNKLKKSIEVLLKNGYTHNDLIEMVKTLIDNNKTPEI